MAHILKNDQIELTLLPEQGCYWRTLRIALGGKWVDLLEPLQGERFPFHFGSYIMAPWSNRIVEGVFEFEGKRHQLRKNFPDDTAIHGDVRNRPWKIDTATSHKFEASLDSRDVPDFNFPFALSYKHVLELAGNRLNMSISIKNEEPKNVPAGFGFHPFFRRALTDLDEDVTLLLPAERVYPDVRCIPTGPAVPVSGKKDLRSERLLGNPNLDDCYTGLTSDLIRLIYRGSKVEVRYRMDPVFSHVVIYAPSDEQGNAKSFVAVEPVTHVNNGFNFFAQGWKGTGIKILKPREIWGGACELTVHGLC